MTTLSTRTDQQGIGLRGLLGATALTLLVVGVAAVWLVAPERGASTTDEGGRGATGRVSARATPGGIALEQYPEMATTDVVAPADMSARTDMLALTDGAGHYFTAADAAILVTPAAPRESRGSATGDCGTTVGPADC
jgi:hypothetical protein